MPLRIGVPRETKSGENRVALTPDGVRAVVQAGGRVAVERNAGEGSGHGDAEYAAAGADLVDAREAWDADLVVKVKEPLPAEFPRLSERSALFTFLHLAAFPELTEELLARRVTAIGYETVEEGGRFPLLAPMSEVAGALSFQVGARGLEAGSGGRGVLLPGAAGAPPGDVVVIGAGNAGRAAVRVAAGAGAEVAVFDVAREKLAAVAAERGGKVRTALSMPRALEEALLAADLVVSTVLVPGDRAPLLVTRSLVRRMRRGAVIVDIAIDQGGTVETSRPTTHDAPYFVEEGVVHYGVTNMPAAVPRTSTAALVAATLPRLLSIVRHGVGGALRREAPLRAGLNTFRGQVTCRGVARALGRPYVPSESLVDAF